MITRKIIGYGFLAVLTTLAFAACESPTDPAHVHDYAWSVTTPATCIATGVETGVCKLDSSHTDTREIPIDLVDGHDWGEWEGTVTCTTAGTGTRTCSRSPTTHIETDNNLQPLGHAYNDEDWEETEAPTCSQKGKEEANCVRYAECGNTATREIAIDPEAHDWQVTSGTPPTCTEDGNGAEICSYNQEHILSGVLPKLGHDYQTYTETTAPTCSAVGKEEAPCTRDSTHEKSIRDIPIDSDAHDWNEWGTPTPATVTEDGFKKRTCKHNSTHEETEFSDEYATGTIGLAYELIGNNTAYRVRKGTVTNGTVHIPAYWRGNSTNYEDYKPVTEIGSMDDEWTEGAFNGTNISTITFAENSQLTTIGSNAFRIPDLTSIIIPASVTSIGRAAFCNCTNLTSITIPASVTSIGEGTFEGCESLASITIPTSITSIVRAAFYNCTSLTSITIPASVTSIDEAAFYRCTSLTSITIPASVTSIGNNAFQDCSSLISVTLPNSLTSIDTAAFQDCSSLASVTIPASVTSIGNRAFYNCTSLTSVTIPASVTSIGNQAFYNCTSLTSVTFNGTIASGSFSSLTGTYSAFPGDLRDKFYQGNSTNGVPGTYTRPNGTSTVWTRVSS
jgi:hypothetical protein